MTEDSTSAVVAASACGWHPLPRPIGPVYPTNRIAARPASTTAASALHPALPKGLQRPPNAPQGLAEALERRRFRGCPPSRSRSITGGERFPGRIVPLPPSFATTYPDRTLVDRVSAFLAGAGSARSVALCLARPCAWPGLDPGELAGHTWGTKKNHPSGLRLELELALAAEPGAAVRTATQFRIRAYILYGISD